MSDDSETGPLTEVTDDSCTVDFIEILPTGTASDDYHTLGFMDELAEVKLEDLQDVKREPAAECETEGQNFAVQVSSVHFS